MLPDEVFVALSLGSGNRLELLSSTVVSRQFRAPGSLVVLSGCESAAGPVLPGAGLQGMTSSWLAAGASAVLGSLWIQPDDAGLFFDAFYRNLRPGSDPESALQAAQTAMIRNAGWRADPRFWSAWILVGRRHS
jgi:CHAT domain-containing protein